MSAANPSWIPRTEALARLGVKTQTLYAYVSRGRIHARPDPTHPRRSLYDASDVARLLDRTAPPAELRSPRRTAAPDLLALAGTATLETAAGLLWRAAGDPFAGLKPRIDLAFPGGPKARLLATLARRADEDAPPPAGQGPANREAASVLADLVDAVAGLGPRLHLHQRLARAWKLNERDAQCLRRALVLAAWPQDDAAMHAARAAAAGGASLSACALAGLAAFQGARLGGGLAQMQMRLAEARRAGAEALFAPGGPALFSTGPDVRAQALLAGVDLSADVRRLVEASAGRGRSPSFEFALVLTARDLDLPREAPFIVAAVGQATNWLAAGVDAHAALSPDGPGAG